MGHSGDPGSRSYSTIDLDCSSHSNLELIWPLFCTFGHFWKTCSPLFRENRDFIVWTTSYEHHMWSETTISLKRGRVGLGGRDRDGDRDPIHSRFIGKTPIYRLCTGSGDPIPGCRDPGIRVIPGCRHPGIRVIPGCRDPGMTQKWVTFWTHFWTLLSISGIRTRGCLIKRVQKGVQKWPKIGHFGSLFGPLFWPISGV